MTEPTPPRYVLHYDVPADGDPEQIGEALGNQIADDLDRLDPDGTMPITLAVMPEPGHEDADP